MREIKFRGRHLLLPGLYDKWVYGSLYSDGANDNAPMIIEPVTDKHYPVAPDTVGQFTGLRDADGREIYEGDVLEYKTWAETGERYVTMGEVRFLQGQFLVVGPKDIEVQGLFSVAHEPALSDVRVVGNVHDNPDLLERGEN